MAKSCSRRSDLVGIGDVSREMARGGAWGGGRGKGGVPRLPFPVSHPFPCRFVLLACSRQTEGLKQANLATLGHARKPTNGISFYRLDPVLHTLFRLKTSFLGRSEMVRPSAFLLCLKTSFLGRSEMVSPSAFLLCLKTSFLGRSEMVRPSAFLLCLKTSFLRRSEMVRPSAFLRCRSEMVRPSAFLRCRS